MKAPKCRVCGDNHYGPCFQRTARSDPQQMEPWFPPDPVPSPPRKTGFDRNAYQREYMRRRRAEEVSVCALYAVVQHKEPDIVKIGQTKKWCSRRAQFMEAKAYSVWFLECPADLVMLENACLVSMGMAPCFGREWFRSTISHAQSCIEQVLNTLHLPYRVEHGSTDQEIASTRGSFDRTAYQREYMRKRRAAGMA